MLSSLQLIPFHHSLLFHYSRGDDFVLPSVCKLTFRFVVFCTHLPPWNNLLHASKSVRMGLEYIVVII